MDRGEDNLTGYDPRRANISGGRCRPANLEESFWVPGVFQFGRGFVHSNFPTHRHIIQLFNIINQLWRKQYNHIFLTRIPLMKRDLYILHFFFKLLLKYLPYLSIYLQWHLLLTLLPTWPFWAEHHWSLPCDRESPLQPCSPFLSPRRLSCQCSGWLCIGCCFW